MDVTTRRLGETLRWSLRGSFVAAIFCVVPLIAGVPSDNLDRIDSFVLAEMARQKVPGLGIAVVKTGRVLVAKGYGFANVEHHVPVRPETIFQSGSVGKQFTSAAVMLLVEQGKIGLEDSVRKFFPEAPASWGAITVHHLLTHTSGIPDYEFGEGPRSVDLHRDYTEDELARFAFGLPLEFSPGSRWNYSNTGYLLLGIIIHKVSGQSYGDFLHDRVFSPLGMNTARTISDEDIVPNRASGYRLDKGVLKNQEWVSPTFNATADGCLYFTLRDMIAWDKGLRAGAILSPKSWEQVYDPVKLNSGNRYPYGFAWFIDTLGNGNLRLHHGGTWQGFYSYISRYQGEDLTIIVLANLADSNPARFVDGIANIFAPSLLPPELKPIPDPEPTVRERLDALLRQARDGRLSPTEFAYVRAGFFPDLAKEYQEQLLKLGTIQKVALLERKVRGDDRIYTYEINFETESIIVTLGIALDEKVSLFRIRPKTP